MESPHDLKFGQMVHITTKNPLNLSVDSGLCYLSRSLPSHQGKEDVFMAMGKGSYRERS